MKNSPLLHADADAFFVSVAVRDRPELFGLPTAVVAHVVVACASYSARKFGVRGGMLVQEAQRLCPDLTLLDVPYSEIEEVGDALFDLFHDVTDLVEPGSVEEAFLDVAASDWEGAIEVAQVLRVRAASELGIPLTVGVGRTKLMAKLASRAGKPDGLHVIRPDQESQLRQDLRPSEVWGIGAKTLRRLEDLEVVRLADLDLISDGELRQMCGTAMTQRLRGIRAGTDDATVRPLRSRTSFTSEGTTTGYARRDWTAEELLELCLQRTCRRAERAGLAGSRLTVTLRPDALGSNESPRSILHQLAIAEATSEMRTWLPLALGPISREPLPQLTGLGVTLSGLVPRDQIQQALF